MVEKNRGGRQGVVSRGDVRNRRWDQWREGADSRRMAKERTS